MKRVAVVSVLAIAALLAVGCSSGSSVSTAPASSASAASPAIGSAPAPSAPAGIESIAPSASATWQPSDGLHIKVVYQLAQAQAPAACDQASSSAKVGVGTLVTLADGLGTQIGTAPLKALRPGDAFGPDGYTFSGWDDAPIENGKTVTHACFYLADFPTTPSASQYDVTINGVTTSFDEEAVQVNGGWLPVLL